MTNSYMLLKQEKETPLLDDLFYLKYVALFTFTTQMNEDHNN